MTNKLATVERLCMDAQDEIKRFFEDYQNNTIKWAQFEKCSRSVKAEAFDNISSFLRVCE